MYETTDSRAWMAEARRRGLRITSDDGDPENGPRVGGPTQMEAHDGIRWMSGHFTFDPEGDNDSGFLYDSEEEWKQHMREMHEGPFIP